MVLVLFLLGIIIVVIMAIITIMLSVLKVNIQNGISKIGIYLFGKIPIVNIKINKTKINNGLKKFKTNSKLKLDKTTFEILKKLSSKIEMLDLHLSIGTEDAVYTSFIVSFISIVISNFLPYVVEKKNYKKIKYKIEPIYGRKKSIYFKTKQYNLCKNGTYYRHNIYRFAKKESG